MTKNHHIMLNLKVKLGTEPPGLGSRQQGLEAVEHFILLLLLLLLLLEMMFLQKKEIPYIQNIVHTTMYICKIISIHSVLVLIRE